MIQNKTRKSVYTLNLGGNFNPEITKMTYPWIKHWCRKIGAEFCEITERKFPQWTETYEKHQVYGLAQQREDDWSIFCDSDTVIHNDFFDVTDFIPRNSCAMNGNDPAFLRWKYNKFLKRDSRHIGACTWFVVASDWTREIFEPPPDLTQEEVTESIFPVQGEVITGLIPPKRLCEDFTFSHNIAKYGLKFMGINDLLISLGYKEPSFLFHLYNMPAEEKVVRIESCLKSWRMM